MSDPAARRGSEAGSGRFAARGLLVAGATGMAAGAAELAAAEGARVFVVARTREHLDALVERIRAAGGSADAAVADLRLEADAAAAIAAARAALGAIDGVFNGAGGSGRQFGDGPLHEIALEAWDETIRLNLTTQFLLAREAIRAWRDEGRPGSIVLMTSVLAFEPAPDHFGTHAYAAAKGAIAALVRSTAAFYAADGIRINAIAPGLVRTPMAARAADDPALRAYAARRQPLVGAFLEPSDAADAALFLLSDAARAITGQVLRVDGGWSVSDVAAVADADP